MPTLLVFTLLICVLLHYRIRHNTKEEDNKDAEFWAKEARSNSTRRRDISSLPYIHVEEAELPFHENEPDREIKSAERLIKSLAGAKILCLTGMSNTDLKLKYGVANLETLAACDENFARLVRSLHKWGKRSFDRGDIDDALAVLSYASEIGSDIGETYKLLAKIAREKDDNELYELTRTQVGANFKDSRKDKVLADIERIYQGADNDDNETI